MISERDLLVVTNRAVLCENSSNSKHYDLYIRQPQILSQHLNALDRNPHLNALHQLVKC